MAIMELEKRMLEHWEIMLKIEFFELFSIENAWHSTTMMEVYELFGKIKQICEHRAGKDGCKFYADWLISVPYDCGDCIFCSPIRNEHLFYSRKTDILQQTICLRNR